MKMVDVFKGVVVESALCFGFVGLLFAMTMFIR